MSFLSLGSLFAKETPPAWDEQDVRFFVQNFLRDRMRTEQLYCERVVDDTAFVRVASPAARQEVLLWQFDLVEALEKRAGIRLIKIVVADT